MDKMIEFPIKQILPIRDGLSDQVRVYFVHGLPSISTRMVCSSLPSANLSSPKAHTNGSGCFPVGNKSRCSPSNYLYFKFFKCR